MGGLVRLVGGGGRGWVLRRKGRGREEGRGI